VLGWEVVENQQRIAILVLGRLVVFRPVALDEAATSRSALVFAIQTFCKAAFGLRLLALGNLKS